MLKWRPSSFPPRHPFVPPPKKRSARGHVSHQRSAPAPPFISLDGNCHVRTRLLASLHQPSDSEPEALGWAKKWDFNFPDIPVCFRAGSGRMCTTPNLCFQMSGERRLLPITTSHERKSAANTKVMEQCVSRRQVAAPLATPPSADNCRGQPEPRPLMPKHLQTSSATKLITFQRADVPQRPNIDRMLNTRSERARLRRLANLISLVVAGGGRTDLCCHDPVMNVAPRQREKYLHCEFFWGEK